MRAPYVIHLHQRGREVDERFFSSREEQERQVSSLTSQGTYDQVWWGFGPTEDPDDWREYGNWERTPRTSH